MARSSWKELGLEENSCDEFLSLRLLGEGSCGAVRADVPCRNQFQKGSGPAVAVKFIHVRSFRRDVLARGGFIGSVLAVLKILKATHNANIVRPFGCWYDSSFSE